MPLLLASSTMYDNDNDKPVPNALYYYWRGNPFILLLYAINSPNTFVFIFSRYCHHYIVLLLHTISIDGSLLIF